MNVSRLIHNNQFDTPLPPSSYWMLDFKFGGLVFFLIFPLAFFLELSQFIEPAMYFAIGMGYFVEGFDIIVLI